MIVAVIPFDSNKPVSVFDIVPHLEWMQEVVGGYVERIPLTSCDLFVCEDGQRLMMPVNPVATLLVGDGRGIDNILGTVIVTGKPRAGEPTAISPRAMRDVMEAISGVAEVKRVMIENAAMEKLKDLASHLTSGTVTPTTSDEAPTEPQAGDIVVEQAEDGGMMLTPLDRKVYTWPEVWQAILEETANSGQWPNVWMHERGEFRIVPTGYGTLGKEGSSSGGH